MNAWSTAVQQNDVTRLTTVKTNQAFGVEVAAESGHSKAPFMERLAASPIGEHGNKYRYLPKLNTVQVINSDSISATADSSWPASATLKTKGQKQASRTK
jgi:hypothetical protein